MLEWKISKGGDGQLQVRLSGDLTEKVDFSELAIDAGAVTFVADGIRHINSQGVKRLFDFVKELAQRAQIRASRCSPSFVHQLNMVPELARCLTVVSVIAPMECTECVAEADTLVSLPANGEMPVLAPRACEVCGAAMELAELEERYFAFAVAPEEE